MQRSSLALLQTFDERVVCHAMYTLECKVCVCVCARGMCSKAKFFFLFLFSHKSRVAATTVTVLVENVTAMKNVMIGGGKFVIRGRESYY